jgi:hypothetical protein
MEAECRHLREELDKERALNERIKREHAKKLCNSEPIKIEESD